MVSLHEQALHALMEADCSRKIELTGQLRQAWLDGQLQLEDGPPPLTIAVPGRPPRPQLVDPIEVQPRKLSTVAGRAALIHAITHIEFNAINLALDAVYRFRGLPPDYYGDWLQVAAEEALHFHLLRQHLQSLGFDYGSYSAHNGLWDMACKTDGDVLVRMALVPRLMEARGLDVTPAIQNKLRHSGDVAVCAILDLIMRDEIGHVAIGNRWYRWCCEQRGVDPLSTFRDLLREYDAPALRAPFHWEARQQAGFTELEKQLIEELAAVRPPSTRRTP